MFKRERIPKIMLAATTNVLGILVSNYFYCSLEIPENFSKFLGKTFSDTLKILLDEKTNKDLKKTVHGQLASALENSISKALNSEEFEIYDDARKALLDAVTTERAISYLQMAEDLEKAKKYIQKILEKTNKSDLRTLPIDNIAETTLKLLKQEIENNSDLRSLNIYMKVKEISTDVKKNLKISSETKQDTEKIINMLEGKFKKISNNPENTVHTSFNRNIKKQPNTVETQSKFLRKQLVLHYKTFNDRKKSLGRDHPHTISSCMWIAYIYYKQENYTKALKWYYKTSDARERILGRDHLDTASAYAGMANTYLLKKDYPEALKWYYKSLDIRERVLQIDHPDIASTYSGIAFAFFGQENYKSAADWHFKTLDIRKRILDKDHPNIASTYYGIANIYLQKRDYSEALKWYHKSLDIRERILGKDHLDTASTYSGIALTFSSQKDYQTALEWHYKVLDIRKRILGENHPSTTSTYSEIAACSSLLKDSKML